MGVAAAAANVTSNSKFRVRVMLFSPFNRPVSSSRSAAKPARALQIQPRSICTTSVPKPRRWEGYTSESAR
jgi:hypothetical protein